MSNCITAIESDRQLMDRAIAMARQAAELGEVPVGAVIACKDRIIAQAHNLCETRHDATAHAEILAIQDASRQLGDWRLNHCTMAVTLEPCPMCAGAIVAARIGRLIYGADDPKRGCVKTLYQLCTEPRFNHSVQLTNGIAAATCGQLLSDFFRDKRHTQQPANNHPKITK